MTEIVKRKRIKKLIRIRIKLIKKVKQTKDKVVITKCKQQIKTIEETIIEIRKS